MPPPPGALAFPMINGTRYDFSSVEITVDAFTYNGFKSISYKHKLTPGKLRGNHPAVIGRTRGIYEVESCTAEMWKADYQTLVDALRTAYPNVGYMEAQFPIIVNHDEPTGDGLITDELVSARIMSDEHGGSEGGDPLVTKIEFDVMRLLLDDQPAVIVPGFLSATA